MTAQQTIQEAARLRYRMHTNNRLRLETMAALSKVFREHEEPIHDELLASLIFAVPQELLGEAVPSSGVRYEAQHGKPAPPPPMREGGPGGGKPSGPGPRGGPGGGKPSSPPPQGGPGGGKPSSPPPKKP